MTKCYYENDSSLHVLCKSSRTSTRHIFSHVKQCPLPSHHKLLRACTPIKKSSGDRYNYIKKATCSKKGKKAARDAQDNSTSSSTPDNTTASSTSFEMLPRRRCCRDADFNLAATTHTQPPQSSLPPHTQSTLAVNQTQHTHSAAV